MQPSRRRRFQHLSEFRAEASFATWLTRIAVHEALARRRREQRFEPLDPTHQEPHEMWTDAAPNPEQHANNRELRVILEAAIDALPDDFRTVFVLRAVEQ